MEGKNPFDTSTKLSAGCASFDPFDYTQGRLASFGKLRTDRAGSPPIIRGTCVPSDLLFIIDDLLI